MENEKLIINDLLANVTSNGFFNEYKDSKEIAQNILDDFKKFYRKDYGYPLHIKNVKDTYTATDSEYGLISNCMALSTILELCSMGADISSFDDAFKFLIEDIFKRVLNGRSYIFDASPYIQNDNKSGKTLDTYIESTALICIIMIDLRSFALNRYYNLATVDFGRSLVIGNSEISDYKSLAKKAEKLMIEAIRVLKDSCLKIDNPIDYKINDAIVPTRADVISSKMRYRGWSFHRPEEGTQNKYELSLFYTYYATYAFISLYNEFANFFDSDIGELSNRTSEEQQKYNDDADFFDANRDLFNIFREETASSGRYIETCIRKNQVDLFSDYVKNDLKKVSFEQVLSSENFHVMDTLFTLAIMTNAGIDDDYRNVNQLEYFYELEQSALANIRKVYGILKRKSKEDMISSYKLSFLANEKYPKDYDKLMQEFRNNGVSFSVFELVPLLCNTHAFISDYLIKYPQKDMGDNLVMIMENKASSGWFWDKGGFNVINNLYYVFALENFYAYYTEYELPLSENGKLYNEKAENARKKLEIAEKELRTQKKQYEALLKEQEEQCRLLEQKYDSKKSSLDIEVEKIVEEVINKKFDSFASTYFDSMFSDLFSAIDDICNDTEDKSLTILDVHKKAHLLLKISNAIHVTFKDMSSTIAEARPEQFNQAIEKELSNYISKVYRSKS